MPYAACRNVYDECVERAAKRFGLGSPEYLMEVLGSCLPDYHACKLFPPNSATGAPIAPPEGLGQLTEVQVLEGLMNWQLPDDDGWVLPDFLGAIRITPDGLFEFHESGAATLPGQPHVGPDNDPGPGLDSWFSSESDMISTVGQATIPESLPGGPPGGAFPPGLGVLGAGASGWPYFPSPDPYGSDAPFVDLGSPGDSGLGDGSPAAGIGQPTSEPDREQQNRGVPGGSAGGGRGEGLVEYPGGTRDPGGYGPITWQLDVGLPLAFTDLIIGGF